MKLNAFSRVFSMKEGVSVSILTLVTLIAVSLFIFPLILSIDSVYGLFAYKGTIETGQFNVLRDISFDNINTIDNKFVAWWSPGQWIFPGILNYLFGIKLGVACIIVTILSTLAGLAGYYKLFIFFKFDHTVAGISTLLILLSNTLYQNFLIYQGGEIISFGIFPWFVYYLLRLKRYSLLNLVVVALFILLCFIAKTTLLIYAAILIPYKILIENTGESIHTRWQLSIRPKTFLLLIPIAAAILLIYFLYILKGASPTLMNNFHFDNEDLLVPLSSPVTGLFSIQSIISRTGTILTQAGGANFAKPLMQVLYLICCVVSIWLTKKLLSKNELLAAYGKLAAVLFLGLSVFFMFAYLFNTNIDYSVRHFKLLSFLFLPFIVYMLAKRNIMLVKVLTVACFAYFIADFIFSKKTWTANRYISSNFFYRNFDNQNLVDQLDRTTYKKVISLDRSIADKHERQKSIFVIEANPDIALDINHPCIFIEFQRYFYKKPYHGHGSALYLFITKETLGKNPGFIKFKFPEYSQVELIDETEKYQIFRAI